MPFRTRKKDKRVFYTDLRPSRRRHYTSRQETVLLNSPPPRDVFAQDTLVPPEELPGPATTEPFEEPAVEEAEPMLAQKAIEEPVAASALEHAIGSAVPPSSFIAYCLATRQHVEVRNPRYVTYSNGARALTGYDLHGHRVVRMVRGADRRGKRKARPASHGAGS